MAKELEAEDIELKDYIFTPKEITVNGNSVIDYTGVENDKVFLCNKKDILDKPRPSWIPELDAKGLALDKFLPICVKDFSDGNYFVQSKIYTGEKDSKGFPVYKNQIYKMSSDVLAATVDYYLKRKRAELTREGSTEKVSLPRGMNSMPTSRYNDISNLCLLCETPSLKYKDTDKSIIDKAFELKGKNPGKLYHIQNNVVFLEQWQPLLENIKGKRLDMNYQKQDYIYSYSKGVETSYGNSNTFNNLYNDYGVKIKKQNGSNFSKSEIDKLSETIKKVFNHYGDLSNLAAEYRLKISYADNCMQFARKAVGLFIAYQNAIGISFFNEEKQLTVAGDKHLPDVTFAHEIAHWLDNQKGKESHNFFASDKYGTLENQIAEKFKDEIKLREKSNKSTAKIGKSNEIHLGEYWFRTCECFARAMEQYYALVQGIDLSEEIYYARKDNFETDFVPLIKELMEENRTFFSLDIENSQSVIEKSYELHDIDATSNNSVLDVYIASNENLFFLIQDKLTKGGLTRFASGYYDSEDHIITGNISECLKQNPLYIIPDDKSFLIVSKNYLDSKYKDFELNYLNENLELEIKNEHSGLSAKSYYNSKDTRKLCHIIKGADRNSEEYKNAIEQMADYFVSQGIFNENSILIPAPQHSGKPEYTFSLAAAISRKTKSPIAEILYCKPHETLYEQKKNGKKPEVEFYLQNAKGETDLENLFDETSMDFWKRNGDKVYLLDNNISTGLTFNKAEKLLPGLIPAPFAIGNFAEITFKNGRYTVNNLLKEKEVINLEHTLEEKTMENDKTKAAEIEPEKKNVRVFTVDDSVLSAVDRADFLSNLEHYVNSEKKGKDIYKINETLNKENLKPVRFIYEGQSYLGSSIYESFVCKMNDNSGYRYLMVPHNAEYYKGFDKLILSEKSFSDIAECQNALIDTLVNLKENHSFKVETKTFQFYNIPEKFKQSLLSYIADNEKEICRKTEEWFKSHPDFEKRENFKDNIAIYLINEPEAVNFNSPEWLKIFENIELSINNPLLAETIEVNTQKENRLMENKSKTTEIKPVTLEEILDVMDMRPDYTANGNFMIYDTQRQEYISSWGGWEVDNGTAVFSNASEAFERLDIYINDYYIHDMQEQLEGVGVEITGDESLADLCKLYKTELEKGNEKLSIGELNLAMGIVDPDTVLYEQRIAKEKSNQKTIQSGETLTEMVANTEKEELRPEFVIFNKIDDEIDKGIESVHVNGGMSDVAIDDGIEKEPVWIINGEPFSEKIIEESLHNDVAELFKQYDSGEIEENLILVGVKMYRNPTEDGKISLLVEFDSKNPENRWREDSLFMALNEEGIEFNGMKVDFNPITREKSGTIEQYLKTLSGFENEEQLIKANAQKLEEKEIENKLNEISSKISEVVDVRTKVLPFSIINNEVKGRVNIKFDTVENNPDFQNIIRELKSNGWKFAPSTRQWYPVGKAVDKAADFANALQEKYSVPLNQKTEAAADINLKKSPYDGIRFFDRNCSESEEFARCFNSRLSEFGKNAGSISEKDATVILRAIGYADNGTPGDRNNRLGLDRKDNLVILTKQNSEVKAVTTDLKGLLDIAREQSEQGLNEANRLLENSKQNKRLPDELHGIFIRLYEECIEQRKEVYEKMNAIYDKYSEKDKTVSKESVLYQRNSYRGWEISASKDFARSVYFRPFDHAGRSGFVLMTGKEGAGGFWQEKMLQELLHTDGWNDKKAVIEAVSAITGSKQACEELGIEYVSSANERLKQLSVISIDSGKEIKDEILGASEQSAEESTIERKIPELIPGEKCGNACAADVYKISDGVYQAALERVSDDGGTTVQNHFVLDRNIVSKLPVALQELTVSFGSRSVIENKRYEPYILRELIELKAMPPRDEDFVEKLDEYISANPLKYEKLYPVTPGNFEDKLRQLSEIDKDLHKNPFELGQQLISMVDDSEKDTLNMWLVSKNCTSKENMEKIFASWIGSRQNIENTKKKDSGYPPRGED